MKMKLLVIALSFLLSYAFGDDPSTEPPIVPPNGLSPKQIPQFVMVTFDDAVNWVNFNRTYKNLFSLKNKKNQCLIQTTFFVSHEYNNYAYVYDLHRRGHEIAVHSVTHKTDNEYWKSPERTHWEDEIRIMKESIVKLSLIPEQDIKGFRAPFLQTAGNITFQILKEQGFLYDSSMPSLRFSNSKGDPHAKGPIFPYKLDNGYLQDCQIEPCPNAKFPGLWITPLNDYWKLREINHEKVLTPCSMADFCLPLPLTPQESKEYFLDNFYRHYNTTRAPFFVSMHEGWLIDDKRRQGYFDFLNEILQHEDVFLVNIQEVLKWMENPVTSDNYTQNVCLTEQTLPPIKCAVPGTYCEYKNLPDFGGGTRAFNVCGSVSCPTSYPWVHTKPPKNPR